MWMFYGMLSIVFALFALMRVLKHKNQGAVLLSFASLFCAVAVMLDFIWMIREWVICEDWSALSDVVPVLAVMLTAAVICCILMNMFTILKVSVKRKKKTELSS